MAPLTELGIKQAEELRFLDSVSHDLNTRLYLS